MCSCVCVSVGQEGLIALSYIRLFPSTLCILSMLWYCVSICLKIAYWKIPSERVEASLGIRYTPLCTNAPPAFFPPMVSSFILLHIYTHVCLRLYHIIHYIYIHYTLKHLLNWPFECVTANIVFVFMSDFLKGCASFGLNNWQTIFVFVLRWVCCATFSVVMTPLFYIPLPQLLLRMTETEIGNLTS